MKRTELRRKTPMSRTGRLKPRSAKMAKLYRTERVPLVIEWLERYPWCQFPLGCTERAVDVHEVLARSQGGTIVDPENLRSSCRAHNHWAEDHPAAAEAIGWKKWRRAA